MLQRIATPNNFLVLLLVVSAFISNFAEANNAPIGVGSISDQALDVGGTAATLDVSGYFSDPDGDTLTYTASSSATAIATVSVSSATVTITAVAAGSATITVTATDPGGSTATQTFSATVTQPNRAPTTVGSIANLTLTVGESATAVDVSGYFSDPDGDTLTYTATSSDTAKATVSVSSATVSITPVEAGAPTVNVIASDGSLSAKQTISVEIAANLAPVTIGTMSDRTLDVGDSMVTNVDAHFADSVGDTLTYTASSSDTSVASASVSGGALTVNAVAAGAATISVTATDRGGLTATQSFTVTANAVGNDAPVAVGTIPKQTLTPDDTSATTIDVSSYFSDPDGDTLTYTATSDDTSKVTVSVSGANISMTPVAGGSVTIVVQATDPDGLFAKQDISVLVYVPPAAPVAVNTIADQDLLLGASTVSIDASLYFSDANGDELTYTAVSSDTAVATISLLEPSVTVNQVGVGAATITITATDPGDLSATQSFSVTVTANSAPTPVGTIPAQVVATGGGTASINARDYFSDVDGQMLGITASSSDTTVATVSETAGTVTITGNDTGTATITVTATDRIAAPATQTFTVTVKNPPTAVGTMPDISGALNQVGGYIDLSGYFSDPDAQTLSYSASSSSTYVCIVAITSSNNLQVTPQSVGTATITVTATNPDNLSASSKFHG